MLFVFKFRLCFLFFFFYFPIFGQLFLLWLQNHLTHTRLNHVWGVFCYYVWWRYVYFLLTQCLFPLLHFSHLNLNPFLTPFAVCNFCNSFVAWVIERDPKDQFRFCSLQSELGRNNLERLGLDDNLSTVVLIEPGDVVHTKYVLT